MMLCAGLCLSPLVFAAETWRGRVLYVFDGDTILVAHDATTTRVRLYGIDAPETDQPFGGRAKYRTWHLAFGQNVLVDGKYTDKYGRLVAMVILPDALCLNMALLADGYAWFWPYVKAPELNALAAAAKSQHRGLWADPAPIPPWTWRRLHSSQYHGH